MSISLKWINRAIGDSISIYRAAAPFTLDTLPAEALASLPATATGYVDASVTDGETYYYGVTANAGSAKALSALVVATADGEAPPPEPTGHRYWRILVHSMWTGTGAVKFAEIAMRAETYGADLSTTAGAIGVTPIGGTLADGFDNNLATEVRFDRPDLNLVWIGQDFGSLVDLRRIEVKQGTVERPRSVSIQSSDDLSTWTTELGPVEIPDTARGSIIEIGTPDAQPNVFPVWAIQVDTNWSGVSSGAQIAEVEMRATAGGADLTTIANAIVGAAPISGTNINSAFDDNLATHVRLPRQDLVANHVYLGQKFATPTSVVEMLVTGTTVERLKDIKILVSVDGIAFEQYGTNSLQLPNQAANLITLIAP